MEQQLVFGILIWPLAVSQEVLLRPQILTEGTLEGLYKCLGVSQGGSNGYLDSNWGGAVTQN